MLNDTALCHDNQCGARKQCDRWLNRNSQDRLAVHATTLKLAYIPHHAPCAYYRGEPIEADE